MSFTEETLGSFFKDVQFVTVKLPDASDNSFKAPVPKERDVGFIRRWVADLRSGRYTQIYGRSVESDDPDDPRRCAIGVGLGTMAAHLGVQRFSPMSATNADFLLLARMCGVSDGFLYQVIEMNDGRRSEVNHGNGTVSVHFDERMRKNFAEIADLIERELLVRPQVGIAFDKAPVGWCWVTPKSKAHAVCFEESAVVENG